jgi:hypothetical protein
MKINILNPYSNCPIYLQLLFIIAFGFVAFLVINWSISLTHSTTVSEGFTYKPSAQAPNNTISFEHLDLVNDASYVCDFLKVDNQLVITDPSNLSASKSDYTMPKTNLQIYGMFNTYLSANSTSNKLTEAMDASYGALFDFKTLKNMPAQDISAQWTSLNPVILDDAIYTTVNAFIVHSDENNRRCPAGDDAAGKGLSSFFLQSIIKNKSSNTTLQSLKHAYYAIIKPRFLANKLSNIYWQNAQSFTNSDKGSNNSILYVLNTFCEIIRTPTLAADLSANGAAKIIGDKTPFPSKEPIEIYQTASVVYEMGRFIAQFGGSGKIKTTPSTFLAGYPKYLEKATTTPPNSPFLFILKNPPDVNECSSATNLQKGFTELQY